MNINNIGLAATPAETVSLETTQPVSPFGKTDFAQRVTDQIQVKKLQETEAKENKEAPFSVQEAEQLSAELNEIMDDLQTSLGFFIREDLNHQVVVEIKNRETNELIKQIPSEELLDIKEKMEELNGLIFDQSV